MMFQKRYSRYDDAELIARVAKGDDRAFNEILNRYQDAVYGFVLRMIGDVQEAEDLAQETFLRLFNVSGRYRSGAALKTFLFRIARNLCIDYFRKKKPVLMEEPPEMQTDETPLDQLQSAINIDRLEKAISALPVNQKTAILLRHSHNMSYQQIALTMELTVSAVESLLVRARRKLHLLLT